MRVVPACFAVPQGNLVASIGIARPAGRAGQIIERPVRRERAVVIWRPDNLGRGTEEIHADRELIEICVTLPLSIERFFPD